MDIDAAKVQEDIQTCLGLQILPPEAQWVLDYRLREKIRQDVWRDFILFFSNSKLRDTSSLSLAQKFILLDSLQLYLIQENKPLDRTLFSKTIRPKLNKTREIFLDIQDILNYQATKKERFRLSSLRKYGPVKDSTFKNPLREKFAQALGKNDFISALEIILLLNYRKTANQSGISKEYFDLFEKELLRAAAELNLDIEKLKNSFAPDRPQLKYADTPAVENKVNITFKKINP